MDDDGLVAAVAARRDSRLLVSRTTSTLETAALARALRAESCSAVLGAKGTVEAVANAQQRRITRRLAQGIYENRSVVWPMAHPAGRRRVAGTGDEDTLVTFPSR